MNKIKTVVYWLVFAFGVLELAFRSSSIVGAILVGAAIIALAIHKEGP